jgi:hypothetical protein
VKWHASSDSITLPASDFVEPCIPSPAKTLRAADLSSSWLPRRVASTPAAAPTSQSVSPA